LQLSQEDGPYSNDTVSYQYDRLGRPSTRTVDAASELFSYDSLGRLTSDLNALGTFDVDYLGETAQMTGRHLRGGTVGTTWTYDTNANDRRLKAIANSSATRGYQFTTLPEGDITQIAETAPAGSAWPPQTWNYGYDGSDRLLNGRSSTGAGYGYSYDAADNITSLQSSAGSANVTFNAVNEIASFNGQSFTYDANGNTLADGLRTYKWDAENRLTSVTVKASGRTTTFRYNGLGLRTAIVSGGVETRYLWCGDSLCQARTATDMISRRYFSEGEAIPAGGTLLYYGQDQLGSVRDVVAVQNGSRLASFDYDPYGYSSQTSGRIATDFRYAGMFYDQGDGLYLTNFRAYDPKTGRWLSRDSRGESAGVNLHEYGAGNPISNIDPLGLSCVSINGNTTCSTPGMGTTTVTFPQPQDWANSYSSGSLFSHAYDEHVSADIDCPDQLMKQIVDNPTPGKPHPATAEGTSNDATPSGIYQWFGPSPVKSYTLMDSEGNEVVVNVTQKGHPLFPGYVVRRIDKDASGGYTVHNFGEGWAVKQSSFNPFAERMFNDVWIDQTRELIKNAQGCTCGR
jgi:RHS repeat-associated protein